MVSSTIAPPEWRENPRFPTYPFRLTFHACPGWSENVYCFRDRLRLHPHQQGRPGRRPPGMDPESQALRLRQAGVEPANIYRDIGVSGSTTGVLPTSAPPLPVLRDERRLDLRNRSFPGFRSWRVPGSGSPDCGSCTSPVARR